MLYSSNHWNFLRFCLGSDKLYRSIFGISIYIPIINLNSLTYVMANRSSFWAFFFACANLHQFRQARLIKGGGSGKDPQV